MQMEVRKEGSQSIDGGVARAAAGAWWWGACLLVGHCGEPGRASIAKAAAGPCLHIHMHMYLGTHPRQLTYLACKQAGRQESYLFYGSHMHGDV